MYLQQLIFIKTTTEYLWMYVPLSWLLRISAVISPSAVQLALKQDFQSYYLRLEYLQCNAAVCFPLDCVQNVYWKYLKYLLLTLEIEPKNEGRQLRFLLILKYSMEEWRLQVSLSNITKKKFQKLFFRNKAFKKNCYAPFPKLQK